MYIVGAGCGDFDLITMRGAEYIRHCDVLVYDSLIDVSLLGFAPETAEKICVGKRSGRHSEKQENINEILVEKAREGKTVVRLKGGDPFVFGRGGEEIEALKSADIPCDIVPGISSSIAVPELAGIPCYTQKSEPKCSYNHGTYGTGHPARKYKEMCRNRRNACLSYGIEKPPRHCGKSHS